MTALAQRPRKFRRVIVPIEKKPSRIGIRLAMLLLAFAIAAAVFLTGAYVGSHSDITPTPTVTPTPIHYLVPVLSTTPTPTKG